MRMRMRAQVHVFVGGVEEKLVANKAITQVVDVMGPYDDKMTKLRAILGGKPRGTRIIIFCSTKRMCDQLARNLSREYGAAAIHGDKKQQERDYVIAAFKNGSNPIMVATDVAARGLDVRPRPPGLLFLFQMLPLTRPHPPRHLASPLHVASHAPPTAAPQPAREPVACMHAGPAHTLLPPRPWSSPLLCKRHHCDGSRPPCSCQMGSAADPADAPLYQSCWAAG
jgi:hypothetical protein